MISSPLRAAPEMARPMSEEELQELPFAALVCQPSVRRRAAWYCVIVGSILVFINHFMAFLEGDVDAMRVCQIVLTYSVPFTVSTLSSVQALRAAARRRQARKAAEMTKTESQAQHEDESDDIDDALSSELV